MARTNRGSTTKNFFHDGTKSNIPVTLTVAEDYYSVFATVYSNENSTLNPYFDMACLLQRYTSGSWKTIDSWLGRVYNRTNRNITFSNIGKKGTNLRVVLYPTASSGSGIIYSKVWNR